MSARQPGRRRPRSAKPEALRGSEVILGRLLPAEDAELAHVDARGSAGTCPRRAGAAASPTRMPSLPAVCAGCCMIVRTFSSLPKWTIETPRSSRRGARSRSRSAARPRRRGLGDDLADEARGSARAPAITIADQSTGTPWKPSEPVSSSSTRSRSRSAGSRRRARVAAGRRRAPSRAGRVEVRRAGEVRVGVERDVDAVGARASISASSSGARPG